MNHNTAGTASAQQRLAPDDTEDKLFLDAIRDPEKRAEVITILKHAGLVPG